MADVSQLFNKVLGRNTQQDVGSTQFWSSPERSGWLMKQGARSRVSREWASGLRGAGKVHQCGSSLL